MTESGHNGIFATTHWSVVLRAGESAAPAAEEALQTLCRAYWYPLYAYVRRRGHGPEDAADLTQGFFGHLLAGDFLQRACRDKGRFRSYLLGALKHYLADAADRDRAVRRGGGCEVISLDGLDAEERYRLEPADRLDAERLFARRWAMTVLDQAFGRLEAEHRRDGKGLVFDRLQGFLVGAKDGGTYAVAATDLGMTEAAVKMAVVRLRTRCRELLRETIAQTVGTPAEAEEEYAALIAALRDG